MSKKIKIKKNMEKETPTKLLEVGLRVYSLDLSFAHTLSPSCSQMSPHLISVSPVKRFWLQK